ncbi:hypothetical protein LTR04_004133 [Oleoguttula sp. CCFEE 6159]|nr:hypothetical protein LTR04_004133 [Oleoguttula sp. CCFEE 6159]
MSPPKTTNIKVRNERPRSAGRAVEHTPPPSPGAIGSAKVDTEGISDDVVVGVIEQLEKTGNRPHLVKELAAVLTNSIGAVESSANPQAIISSRLTSYLRRPWTALSPCPLTKELVATHPRRIYFYLATSPHQPIPEHPEIMPSNDRIITPSISSAADEEEERDARARATLSPSPEIDLSSPELEDDDVSAPPTPGGSFSGRNSLPREHPPTTTNISHNRRAVSPPLEHEEREFTRTANSLQQRSRSQGLATPPVLEVVPTTEHDMDFTVTVEVDETEESAALRNSEAAAALFGHDGHLSIPSTIVEFSSPMLKPQLGLLIPVPVSPASKQRDFDGHVRILDRADGIDDAATDGEQERAIIDAFGGWAELQSPENVELEELDQMFGWY